MQLAFYRATGKPFNRLIRFFTKPGEYSHVELVFSNGECFSASARDKGTRFKNIKLLPGRWDLVNLNRINAESEVEIHEWCKSQEGKPYDWLGILGFLFHRRWQKSKWWYCSEVSARAIRGHYMTPDKIDPNLLGRLINDMEATDTAVVVNSV